ncbi:nucleotidyl transferase AbiEii/AbiGii toxin family protein [Prosthecobacter sp.]|uniref:nucleotidyl transferase AbiEii/AbiGii toxin family protein n=1 Tax=Prosthecobacter sp. TaxID=1965333 RepID=UPI001D33A05E|nr:nucleotidyl transferase AbiEii/AbiGii toxin family protein [Prosthecobacter sp.]MCB1276444.1 nucleotidyl transferase AbiEii/AbiGii toxin family protein [Prosthecobacter sp.]
MKPEPRQREDYSERQIQAAHRVLVDLGQVLASFKDSLVIVGGWTPDLLLPDAAEPHIGSIDVDLALDAAKLGEGQYAQLIKLLLDTKRYQKGEKDFQLVVEVDLKDGEKPVIVEVDFLAAQDVKMKKNKPKLLEGFRVLKAEGCNVAFNAPEDITIPGQNVQGAKNTVHMRVVSLADFVLMKAHAIGGRDKPKDVYDLCYALTEYPGGIETLAADWNKRLANKDVAKAIAILDEKFPAVDAFGPQQLVEFHDSDNQEERDMQARRAFELVQSLLGLLAKK